MSVEDYNAEIRRIAEEIVRIKDKISELEDVDEYNLRKVENLTYELQGMIEKRFEINGQKNDIKFEKILKSTEDMQKELISTSTILGMTTKTLDKLDGKLDDNQKDISAKMWAVILAVIVSFISGIAGIVLNK